jgi:hypothetical protein
MGALAQEELGMRTRQETLAHDVDGRRQKTPM